MPKAISDSEIATKIEYIRISYEKSVATLKKQYSWKKSDARIVAFVKGVRIMNAIQIGFDHLIKNLKIPEWWVQRYPGHQITAVNQKRLCEEFDLFFRTGLINDLYGSFESSLRLFAGAYDSETFSNMTISISKIYPKFFQMVDVKQYEDLFKIWCNIRNTIHNDGMFNPPNQKDELINYNDEQYKFYVGKPVVHTGWFDLLELSFELGKMTFEIVNNTAISSISYIEEPNSKFWDIFEKPFDWKEFVQTK